MMRASIGAFAVLFVLQVALAQDFQKTYTLAEGGQILIGNFLGDIKVTGYSGSTVEIKAYKKGPERDAVEIRDLSFGNRVELSSHHPRFHRGQSTVDFEIRVPNSIRYNFARLSSFGGNVAVSNVIGMLRAESIRGNVEVRDVRGLVSASSVSGNVNVEIIQTREPGNMRFRSISGNVVVVAPANLDALIAMSSDSGMLRTDFAIDIQERRYGPGREARGKLGSGRQVLWINSNSGRVSLIQKPERQPS
jgi:hypothetical protein